MAPDWSEAVSEPFLGDWVAMDLFDYFQFVALILFYGLLVSRILLFFSRGINPLAIGAGGKGFKGLLEVLFVLGLALWTLETASHALNRGFHVFPPNLYADLFRQEERFLAGHYGEAYGAYRKQVRRYL